MPAIERVVETAIYGDDLDQLERFYNGILGLPVIGKEPGRHVFFQVGSGNVLLAFKPAVTLEGGMLPAHGTQGPGHFALGIKPESLEEWRSHLQEHGIAIEQQVVWPKGGKSIYFRDPAGNSVELVTPGIWGLQSGW